MDVIAGSASREELASRYRGDLVLGVYDPPVAQLLLLLLYSRGTSVMLYKLVDEQQEEEEEAWE